MPPSEPPEGGLLLPHGYQSPGDILPAAARTGAFSSPSYRVESFMYGAGNPRGDTNRPGFLLQEHYSYSGEVYDTIGAQDLAGQPVGTLVLKEISRKESGRYSVIATSPRGSTNSSFTIDVLCKYPH